MDIKYDKSTDRYSLIFDVKEAAMLAACLQAANTVMVDGDLYKEMANKAPELHRRLRGHMLQFGVEANGKLVTLLAKNVKSRP